MGEVMITRRDSGRCHQMVWDQFHHHQCMRRSVVEEDGKRWCRQHLPSVVKARRDEVTRKYKAKDDQRMLLHSTRDRLITAVLEAEQVLDAVPVEDLRQAIQAYKEARK